MPDLLEQIEKPERPETESEESSSESDYVGARVPLLADITLKLSRQLLTAPKPKLRIVVQKVLFFGSHRFPEGFLLIGTGIRCFGTINVVVS